MQAERINSAYNSQFIFKLISLKIKQLHFKLSFNDFHLLIGSNFTMLVTTANTHIGFTSIDMSYFETKYNR